MTTILVAADARWVRDQVRAAFVGPGQRVVEVTRGQDVRDAFARERPDLVILDLNIGNMGGIAAGLDLRHEESGDRLPRARILLLLDRVADKFLGKRADVDAMLVKPVDAGILRRAAKEMLERGAGAAGATETSDETATDETADTADTAETTESRATADTGEPAAAS